MDFPIFSPLKNRQRRKIYVLPAQHLDPAAAALLGQLGEEERRGTDVGIDVGTDVVGGLAFDLD